MDQIQPSLLKKCEIVRPQIGFSVMIGSGHWRQGEIDALSLGAMRRVLISGCLSGNEALGKGNVVGSNEP